MSSATDTRTHLSSADGVAPLPSGDLTILFTDVEGSTNAWERHPEAMPRAMRLHKSLIARAVGEHSGVVIKDTGMGCLRSSRTLLMLWRRPLMHNAGSKPRDGRGLGR